jgi:hypothetical protein
LNEFTSPSIVQRPALPAICFTSVCVKSFCPISFYHFDVEVIITLLMFKLRPIPIASVAIRNFTWPSRLLNCCACYCLVSGGNAP